MSTSKERRRCSRRREAARRGKAHVRHERAIRRIRAARRIVVAIQAGEVTTVTQARELVGADKREWLRICKYFTPREWAPELQA